MGVLQRFHIVRRARYYPECGWFSWTLRWIGWTYKFFPDMWSAPLLWIDLLSSPSSTAFCGTPWTLSSILNFSSSAAGFPMPEPSWWELSRWTCQAFFRIDLGGGRGDSEAFWYRISSVLVFTTLSVQSAGTKSYRLMTLDRVCQNFNPLS